MNKIDAVKPITNYEVYKVLTSEKLTDKQKAEFIKNNAVAIKNIAKTDITAGEFKEMMAHRPLIRFRPLKNSFTKQGDAIILAQSLNIDKKDINKYINSVIENNFELQDNLKQDNIDKLKTYVYRHGTKDQLVSFLEYELSDAKTTLKKMYKLLDDNSGGLCEYFSRPIHRMSNITLGKIYNIIDKSLRNSVDSGYIDETKYNSTAQWALVKIYEIQNNSKLIRACNLYKDLT